MAKVRNRDYMYIGSLFTSELPCAWPGCDSWKTLELEIVGHRGGEPEVVSYPFCFKHLEEFVDKYVFGSDTNIILHPDGTTDE